MTLYTLGRPAKHFAGRERCNKNCQQSSLRAICRLVSTAFLSPATENWYYQTTTVVTPEVPGQNPTLQPSTEEAAQGIHRFTAVLPTIAQADLPPCNNFVQNNQKAESIDGRHRGRTALKEELPGGPKRNAKRRSYQGRLWKKFSRAWDGVNG